VAKLADFGVAHLAGDEPLTRTGDVVGTLAYMAPEQAAGQRVDERADLYSLALVLYEAFAGVHPVRAGSPAATARRVGTVLPSLRRARRDLPPELAAAIDRALRPRPDERGELAGLAAALADALPEVSDDGGTVAAHPLERTETLPLPRGTARAGAALLAAGLAALAVHGAGTPEAALHGATALHGAATAAAAPPAAAGVPAALRAPAAPFVAALAALLAVAALPRAGWLAGALAAVGLLAPAHPAVAVIALAAAAPVPALLPRRGTGWSVPALAPLLGLASLAGVYPVLAGRARGWYVRAALGALGAWWLLLAAPLLQRRLFAGPPPPLPADAGRAAGRVLAPLVTGGALAYALVWALAALALPWLVRGRWLVVDAVAASAWAAALGAGTAAVAQSLDAPEPAGLVPAAVAAGALALILPRIRRGPTLEP
jgi:eukaryotic-like serine/threonine-protein kinase